jgi:hypothetical protein
MVQTKECAHIFHQSCLLQRFYASNPDHVKCLICSRQLFRRTPPEPPAKGLGKGEDVGYGDGHGNGDTAV